MSKRALRRRSVMAGQAAGFTLVELLMTFVVLAVMLTLAAPSFISFQRNAELTSAANSFAAALSAARAEAMKRQLNVMIRPYPIANNDWRQGSITYADVNWDFAYTGGTDVQVSQQGAMSGSIDVSSDGTPSDSTSHYLMFSGAGFLRNADGTFGTSRSIALTNGSETRFVIVNPAGRMRVCNPARESSCSAADSI